MKRFLFLALLGIAGAMAVRHFFTEGIYLATDSMSPTLPQGTHVFVNKLSPFLRSPRRGDIIMFDSPNDPDKGLIKRVIAVGGDDIEIRAKKVFINGQEIDEPYVKFLHPETMYQGDNMGPLHVSHSRLFVMGDNRDVSGDSRDWKRDGEPAPFIEERAVLGYVTPP